MATRAAAAPPAFPAVVAVICDELRLRQSAAAGAAEAVVAPGHSRPEPARVAADPSLFSADRSTRPRPATPDRRRTRAAAAEAGGRPEPDAA